MAKSLSLEPSISQQSEGFYCLLESQAILGSRWFWWKVHGGEAVPTSLGQKVPFLLMVLYESNVKSNQSNGLNPFAVQQQLCLQTRTELTSAFIQTAGGGGKPTQLTRTHKHRLYAKYACGFTSWLQTGQ